MRNAASRDQEGAVAKHNERAAIVYLCSRRRTHSLRARAALPVTRAPRGHRHVMTRNLEALSHQRAPGRTRHESARAAGGLRLQSDQVPDGALGPRQELTLAASGIWPPPGGCIRIDRRCRRSSRGRAIPWSDRRDRPCPVRAPPEPGDRIDSDRRCEYDAGRDSAWEWSTRCRVDRAVQSGRPGGRRPPRPAVPRRAR